MKEECTDCSSLQAADDQLQQDVTYVSQKCELFDGQCANLYDWKETIWTFRSWNNEQVGVVFPQEQPFFPPVFTKALTKRTQLVSQRWLNPWTAFIRAAKPGRQTTLTCAGRETQERSWHTPPTFVWLPTGPCDKALWFERRHQKWTASLQHRSCVKVEVAVLGYRL